MSLQSFSVLNPHLSEDKTVLTLSLDHGKANEMGSDQLQAWSNLTSFLSQGLVRSVITTSQRKSRSGKSLFISGANVTERRGWDNEKVKAHVRWQRQVLQSLRESPVFHICVVDGIALGWGTEFLLCCDYRISTENASFGLPETSLGILPGAGGTSELWMEIGLAHALRLGMTGERINGSEATRIGLTQELHSSWQEAMNRANALADLASRRSPTAIAALKDAMLAARGVSSAVRRELEATAYEHCVDTGEAAIGRKHFKEILAGEKIEWGQFQSFSS